MLIKDFIKYEPRIMAENNFIFNDEELDTLAKRFKILSEPSRLRILRSLFSGEKCVTEIIEFTGLLQANVSKQLKILQNNGILECRPQGLQRFYKLSDQTIFQICGLICGSKVNQGEEEKAKMINA